MAQDETAGMVTVTRDALLEAIKGKAAEASPAELEQLAGAYQRIVFGPQGGRMVYDGRTMHRHPEKANGRTGFA